MRPPRDAVAVTEQLAGERDRRPPLSHARRAVKEIGMRRPLPQGRAEQLLRLLLLDQRLEDQSNSCTRPRIVAAISSAGRDPSSSSMRAENRRASSA
jgi:hypothetical protein